MEEEEKGTVQRKHACSSQLVQIPLCCFYKASTARRILKKRLRNDTHNDTVLAYVDIGANLGCIDNTVLFYEDVITDVEWEKSHPATGELFVQVYNRQTNLQRC